MKNTPLLWRILIPILGCLVLLGIAFFLLASIIPDRPTATAETAEVSTKSATQPVAPEREQAYEGEIPEAVQDAQKQQALLEQESDERKLARSYLSEMTLDEKIYQLFFVTPEQLTAQELCTAFSTENGNPLESAPVGGVVFFSQNLVDPTQTSEMISAMQAASRTPLFVGIDEEGGSVSRIGKLDAFDVPQLPAMKTYGDKGDLDSLKSDVADLASDLSFLGFNTDFAPVADVAANEESPIGSRSFGSDPTLCGKMVDAAVSSMQSCKVAACLKHFPGYGAASKSGTIDKTAEQLKTVDLIPFQSGIEADAFFVMVCHLAAPQISGKDTPANHSREIVTNLLREGLAFSNIIITDAQNAAAVTGSYSTEQTVLAALDAGCDMILMPQSLDAAYNAVFRAVQTGKLSAERLDESVLRILTVKAKLGLIT